VGPLWDDDDDVDDIRHVNRSRHISRNTFYCYYLSIKGSMFNRANFLDSVFRAGFMRCIYCTFILTCNKLDIKTNYGKVS
jgi:hypothetical protein